MTINTVSFDVIAAVAKMAREETDPVIVAQLAHVGDVIAREAQENPAVTLTADFVYGYISASIRDQAAARLIAAVLAMRFMDGTL